MLYTNTYIVTLGDTIEGVKKRIKRRIGDPLVEFEDYGRISESPETSFFSGLNEKLTFIGEYNAVETWISFQMRPSISIRGSCPFVVLVGRSVYRAFFKNIENPRISRPMLSHLRKFLFLLQRNPPLPPHDQNPSLKAHIPAQRLKFHPLGANPYLKAQIPGGGEREISSCEKA